MFVKRIGVKSFAMAYAEISFLISLVLVAMIGIMSWDLVSLVGAIVLVIPFVVINGFVTGIIFASLYNFFTGHVGTVSIEVETKE